MQLIAYQNSFSHFSMSVVLDATNYGAEQMWFDRSVSTDILFWQWDVVLRDDGTSMTEWKLLLTHRIVNINEFDLWLSVRNASYGGTRSESSKMNKSMLTFQNSMLTIVTVLSSTSSIFGSNFEKSQFSFHSDVFTIYNYNWLKENLTEISANELIGLHKIRNWIIWMERKTPEKMNFHKLH